MDLDLPVTILVVGAALLSLRLAIKNRAKAWFVVQAVNLSVLGAAWAFARGHVAEIAGPVWMVSVLAPGIATKLADRALRSERFAVAYALARIAAFLHPTAPMKLRVIVTAVQRDDRAGRLDAARAGLARLRAHPAGATLATLLGFRLEGRWGEVREWTEAHLWMIKGDGVALSFYVRALGELGDIETLCETLADAQTTAAYHQVEDQLLLFAAAFAGLKETTLRILARRHPDMPADAQRYWELAAAHAAGENVDAELRALAESTYPRLAQAARARADAPAAATTSEEARRFLDEITRTSRLLEHAKPERPTASWPIALVNLYVFAREIPGGSTDAANLQALGALSLSGFHPSEWYRLVTATVLHFGFAHVAMNMLGVWVLGPDVEASMGRLRAVFVYVGSGVLANVLAVVLAGHGGGKEAILVGASGSVMGLAGALFVRRVVAWRRRRTPLAMAGIRSLLGLFALQIVFDAVTPHVSGSVHVFGACAGALLALLVGAPSWERPPAPRRHPLLPRVLALGAALLAIGALELAFAKTSATPPALEACEAGDAEACAAACSDPTGRWTARCIRTARKLARDQAASEDAQRRAFVIFRATCDAGSLFGCTSEAVMLHNGDGTESDPAKARLMWLEACDAGESAACSILERHRSPANHEDAAAPPGESSRPDDAVGRDDATRPDDAVGRDTARDAGRPDGARVHDPVRLRLCTCYWRNALNWPPRSEQPRGWDPGTPLHADPCEGVPDDAWAPECLRANPNDCPKLIECQNMEPSGRAQCLPGEVHFGVSPSSRCARACGPARPCPAGQSCDYDLGREPDAGVCLP